MSPAPPRPLTAAAAFVSGFCIMSIEMLGARLLSPYFGGSLEVWGSVIAVFMLALALGYLAGGRLSVRRPSAAAFAGFFFAAAALSLPLVLFADPVMEPIFLRIEDARYGSLLASLVLFFPPTVVLGMISPYAVRLMAQSRERSGHAAGLLYFVSTLGSAAGTLGTSFYLVLWFEVNRILWGAAAALAAAGAVLLLAGAAAGRAGRGA